MTPCEVSCLRRQRTVKTPDELEAFLDECDQSARAEDYPVIVEFYDSRDRSFLIGVGADLVPVMSDDEALSPTYATSLGIDPDRRDFVEFGYSNTYIETLGATLVPQTLARQAAHDFFAHRARPTNITFRDDLIWMKLQKEAARPNK